MENSREKGGVTSNSSNVATTWTGIVTTSSARTAMNAINGTNTDAKALYACLVRNLRKVRHWYWLLAQIGDSPVDVTVSQRHKSHPLFLGIKAEWHVYYRYTLEITVNGTVTWKPCSVPDHDKTENEPDFSSLSGRQIASILWEQLSTTQTVPTPEITLESVIRELSAIDITPFQLVAYEPWHGEVGIEELYFMDPWSINGHGDYVMDLLALLEKTSLPRTPLINILAENKDDIEWVKTRIGKIIDNMLAARLLLMADNGTITSNIRTS